MREIKWSGCGETEHPGLVTGLRDPSLASLDKDGAAVGHGRALIVGCVRQR